MEDKKQKSAKEKFEHYWDILFIILEVFTLIGFVYLLIGIEPLRKDLIEKNKSYNFPKYSDLYQLIYIVIAIAIFRYIIIQIFSFVGKKIMGKKYSDPSRPEDFAMGKILPNKIGIHFYKMIFYLLVTIFGYIEMKDLNYFPPSCFGKGEMKNMFLPGYPNSCYHEKPKYFDLFYLFCFGYYLCDFICLLISKDKSNEFILMILHHTCTSGLILLSYLSNFTNIGSLILFIQCVSDIPNHLTKILLRTDIPYIFIVPVGVSFVFTYWYYRIFVHCQILYTIYHYATWKWTYIETFLTAFLFVLLVMQIYWSSIMLFILIKMCVTRKKVMDNVEYKDSIKRNMDELAKQKQIKKNTSYRKNNNTYNAGAYITGCCQCKCY